MLKGFHLLQIHVLPKHADNFQHYPDDNLSMLPFCLFLFTDEKLQFVKWASWPPATVKNVCVCARARALIANSIVCGNLS